MMCPTCGSGPVQIHGNTWECGFCGDTGMLPTQKPVPEPHSSGSAGIWITVGIVLAVLLVVAALQSV